MEYVFLGREDEGAGGMCRCQCGFKSGLIVREGEERDMVKLGGMGQNSLISCNLFFKLIKFGIIALETTGV